MNKRLITLSCIFLLALGYLVADAAPIRPRSNEVVFIVKLRMQPSLPLDFFKAYVDNRRDMLIPPALYLDLRPLSGRNYGVLNIGTLNEFCYVAVRTDRDRQFALRSLDIRLFDKMSLTIRLPFNEVITVPEGVDYVYIGTFIYRSEDEYFTPSITLVDDFDQVLAELQTAFGPSVRMIRSNSVPGN